MPILRLLQDRAFDPEAIKVITQAYERACNELRLVDRTDPLTELVAKAIISVAETGESNPDRILQAALQKLGVRDAQ